MKRILLLGSPNVGKSVVFNRLTGVSVISSNYPGTTVEFTSGKTVIDGIEYEVVDVPGSYTLEPTCKAEEVARRILDQSEEERIETLVVNVIDATNLERSLNLTLQLLQRNFPMVAALNFWDETRHTGIEIDLEKLAIELGMPCVPVTAITGEGIGTMAEEVGKAQPPSRQYSKGDRWQEIGRIVGATQKVNRRQHTVLERLGDASVNPVTAVPIAIFISLLSFAVIRFIGEGMIDQVFNPLFELYRPLMTNLSWSLGGEGFLHDLLIGKLIDGKIDFFQAFGLLTTGLYVPLGAVFPYIFSFYLVLSIMEDSGYLPRLAVLVDALMHKLGLHGMSIIPMMLGLGCNVPGALAARILETRRERFIVAVVMSITIPCMAQTAMVSALIGSSCNNWKEIVGAFSAFIITLAVTALLLSRIMNMAIKGESTELLIDIPPYRIPFMRGLVKKVIWRLWWFVREALPFVMLGVLIIQMLEMSGIIGFIGHLASPIVTNLLGLPNEAVGGMLAGLLRKDMAVGMLKPLALDWRQAAVASVVLTMYFPCVATFSVLLKEFGIKDMIKASTLMIITALTIGTLLNLTLVFF